MSSMFLLLILSSINLSPVKHVNAASGDLVNYNNNFNMYTSPNDPNKDSAMQNANCVINFMQTYVYAASTASNCNSTSSPSTPSDHAQTPIQGQAPVQSQSHPAAPEGPQTGISDQSESVGIVKVVDTNTNGGTFAPTQNTSSTSVQSDVENKDDDDKNKNDKDAKDKDDDDDDDDDDKNKNDKDAKDKDDDDDDDKNKNDKDAKDKDDDDDDKNKNDDNNRGDKRDSETKVYNENTVTKEERKLLLTACFERAYDKGNYLSTKEIVKCAENYNS
ncbi:conserved exported protein of unknown function [Candidatus Nitrosocosmicus franklandus]|uniref:Uncharacterized protein n=2 Tax=Candidatus Nitrosocosmicus franklandianus TaxID=1798806 RepID=A0A484I998_9ARCH|nr:conserved exported protein of unknown function [Candidatus Nitrosocosmicus franklandus]